jgi:23S rRNA (cytidine1920-2'-O)/16S rRNA (cytidine1409-2'-O)-methyltransferase
LLPDVTLTVSSDESDRYVSRGGLKLAGALEKTGVDVRDAVCLDVGQSTGGFSDCLLQAGARHVVGVDVGHGQLHPKLKNDPRITMREGINCRALCAADLGDAMPAGGFDLIVGDVSFISMSLILPQLPALLAANGQLVLLIKPQFEVGPGNIGKGGIVRDTTLYRELERRFLDLARTLDLTAKGWFDSPITGGDGNREFFIWLSK